MENILPRITVVTPSYNQGDFLEECIDSVLNQNYPDLEYIIMDGGSTDNSVEIIKKYEKYLTYWQSEPDGGQYSALDAGFRKSSGEIMSWVNSDDKYHAFAFDKISTFFKMNPEVEWVVGRPTVWDKNGHLSKVFRGRLPDYSRANHLKKEYLGVAIQQESTFWRRSLWAKSGGYISTKYNYAGDLELWNRFYRNAELYTLNELIGGFRIHGDQKSFNNYDDYIKEAEEIINKELLLDIKSYNDNSKTCIVTSNHSATNKHITSDCMMFKTNKNNNSYIDKTTPIHAILLSLVRKARLETLRALIYCNQYKVVRILYNVRNIFRK